MDEVKEVTVMNPYGDAPVATMPQPGQAMVAIEQVRAIAEIKGAIQAAQERPRVPRKSMDRILVACQMAELARLAIYAYARGGTDIQGGSIRLAETIALDWQNLDYGIIELEQRSGESTVMAYCLDLENNVKAKRIFQVKHERHTKKGHYSLTDPRDIYETVANQGARRLRACIFEIIPKHVQEAALAQCEATMLASEDTSQGALKKLMDAFMGLGITQQQIEARIQRNIAAIAPAQIVSLRKIYTSLSDGMSVPGDWFEMPAEAKIDPSASLKEKIRQAKSKIEQTTTGEGKTDLSPGGPSLAPGKCPNTENVETKESCDACKDRERCPVWE